jgi:hypothetical protein
MNDFINYYDLLRIKKDSTPEEIKKAYRNQAKKWHPDINKDENAPKISKQLNEAKEVLLNLQKRKEYDEYLEQKLSLKYQTLKDKETKQEAKQSNNQYQNPSNQNYSKNTYTKWEYFQNYLKYYQTSKLKKALTTIFVIIETTICTILQLINYLLALILCYTINIISYFASIILTIYIIYIIYILTTNNSQAPQTIASWFQIILNIFLMGLIILLPEFILKILVEVTPRYISNLNIYLFKKAVSYKD